MEPDAVQLAQHSSHSRHGVTVVTGMRPPSPHLTWEELACRDGTPYPGDWRRDRLLWLCDEFEALRSACGPLLVNSAYRTPAYNRRIGGAVRSQHCEGRALDLVPVRCSVEELYRAALERSRVGKIRGLARYRGGFVHIDIRPSAHVVEWGLGLGEQP